MSDYKNLRLDQQLCFALYSATHAVTRTYRENLSKIGLTYPQYLVLLVLWQENEQTVKSLADKLNLDSATLTPLLKRLAGVGFVTRERGMVDEREVYISLTEAGNNLKDTVCQIQQCVSCETGLNEFEYFELRNKLHHLLETMQLGQQKKPNLLKRLLNGIQCLRLGRFFYRFVGLFLPLLVIDRPGALNISKYCNHLVIR